jgi:hypothetical protein
METAVYFLCDKDNSSWKPHYIINSRLPDIQVTWKPPGKPFLCYQALYRGIYEYLRETPDHSHHSQALVYLRSLKACYTPTMGETLQLHRIMWTEAWLDDLGEPDSDAETVVGEGDR